MSMDLKDQKSAERDDLVVCNRNINIIVAYCVKHGVTEGELLSGLGYPIEYLTNPDQWVSLPVFHEITKRARRALDDDPSIFFEIGLSSTKEGGLGALEVMKRMIGVFFVDPAFLIKKIPEYNQYFNKTKRVEVIEVNRDSAILLMEYKSPIDPVYDFNSGPLTKGVVASVPMVWNLPPAHVDEALLEYDILRLLKEHFSMFTEIRDQVLYVDGAPYGRVVELEKERTRSGEFYLGKYRELIDPTGTTGILITKSLYYKSYPLLIPGQIYNAPYFILKTYWSHASFFSRVRSLLQSSFSRSSGYLKDLEERTMYFQKYARELEETIKERNKIITEEKGEVDRLKNELSSILGSHLPPDLVHAMTTHKLVPKRNRGVVLFADLVGFSKRVHASENFSEVLHDLNRYFEVATGSIKPRGGWVYKFLGDGIMAVFGGYRANEEYAKLGLGAVESAVIIRKLVNEMGWGIRFGIEYGEFIAGEIGPPGERIWDFLGETMNFAARLEQNASENEILLGPHVIALLKESVLTHPKQIIMKGIGEQHVFSLESIKNHAE